jgi:hypothetical protein
MKKCVCLLVFIPESPLLFTLKKIRDIIFWPKNDLCSSRDESTGATGMTAVAPKFLDTLTLFQPGGKILPIITELQRSHLKCSRGLQLLLSDVVSFGKIDRRTNSNLNTGIEISIYSWLEKSNP